MEKLQDLSQSELQELLDNTERVESMALESDEIQNIQLEREMALASNRSLAEQNLDMKPRLEMQRDVLVERYSQLETVRDAYRQHCSLKDGIVGQVSPEALFSRLQAEGSNTEAESETLADEFLEGSLPLDSFLERFLSLRSLAHRRRVRVEKFQDVLRQRSESADPSIMTSSTGAADDHNQQQQTSTGAAAATSDHHQQMQPHPAGPTQQSGGPGAPPSSSSGMPYAPYPVAPPMPAAAAAAPANPPSQFPPYPSPGSPFAPAAGYHPPRAPPAACPYPTQPTGFPAPHPGSAFGQYTPTPSQPGAAAPYPASYSYGGYSYPAAPSGYSNSHSPTGRPVYRPGYGVPQPYS